ncbi:peptidylprolyl isomerase, partial [Acinetobacter baumannii]
MTFQFAPGTDESAMSAAEAKAKKALERVQNGEDFATVAREMSDSFGGKLGGDMGFLGRGQMGKEYADVAYTLKDGEVSPIIKT